MLSRRDFLKVCASTMVGIGCSEVLFQLSASSEAGNRQIPILVYHRVGYTKDYLTVTPERFSSDLQSLQQQGYSTITLEKLQSFISNKDIQLPDRPILITFDDGYLDNYQHAYPILKKYGMVASFFVIADKLWSEDRLNAKCIVEMAKGGMSFGSHTVTHRRLADLVWDDIYNELFTSKAILENILEKTVTAVAYPLGSYNQNVITLADNLGYSTGFTVREGLCLKNSPDFELRRIPIFKYDSGILNVMKARGGI